jgi:two-component system sensor histidine kinase DesK
VITHARHASAPPGLHVLRIRGGQLLGLLFLLGPLSDLDGASIAEPRRTAILSALAVFVALYLALLPPVHAIARRGQPAVRAGLALLALTAGLILALGAPRSFALLFVYVVAAAGLLLRPRLAAAVTVVTAAGVTTGLVIADSSSATVATHVLSILAIGAMMAAFGNSVRTNRELRYAREEVARLAVSEERLRIARDLHDLLGHTLSLVALKSELATKLVTSDPARAQEEMREVQAVTRNALTEVREAVHGYRRLAFDDALDGARAVLSAAGIDCRVDSSAAELPEDVEGVLAWAVREAATNVVRHSEATACAITLSSTAGAVALQVDDDGAGPAAGRGDGFGLTGLAERARRLHGSLEAGARPEGGFRLRLTLPLRAT